MPDFVWITVAIVFLGNIVAIVWFCRRYSKCKKSFAHTARKQEQQISPNTELLSETLTVKRSGSEQLDESQISLKVVSQE